MKILLIALLLTGCSTVVPVARTMPDAPEPLMEKCIPLAKLKEEPKLSEVAASVSYNYSLYHECSLKVEEWQNWYSKQKQIFEQVK